MREQLHAVAMEVDEKASGAIVASHELLVRGALEQSAAAQSEVARLQGSVDEVSSGAAAVEDAIEQGLKLLQEQVSAPPCCLPPRRRTAAPPLSSTASVPSRPSPPAWSRWTPKPADRRCSTRSRARKTPQSTARCGTCLVTRPPGRSPSGLVRPVALPTLAVAQTRAQTSAFALARRSGGAPLWRLGSPLHAAHSPQLKPATRPDLSRSDCAWWPRASMPSRQTSRRARRASASRSLRCCSRRRATTPRPSVPCPSLQQHAGPNPASRRLSRSCGAPVAGAAVAGALRLAEAAAGRERDATIPLSRMQPGAAARRDTAAAAPDLNLSGAVALTAAIGLAASQSAAVGLPHAQRGHGGCGVATSQAVLRQGAGERAAQLDDETDARPRCRRPTAAR